MEKTSDGSEFPFLYSKEMTKESFKSGNLKGREINYDQVSLNIKDFFDNIISNMSASEKLSRELKSANHLNEKEKKDAAEINMLAGSILLDLEKPSNAQQLLLFLEEFESLENCDIKVCGNLLKKISRDLDEKIERLPLDSKQTSFLKQAINLAINCSSNEELFENVIKNYAGQEYSEEFLNPVLAFIDQNLDLVVALKEYHHLYLATYEQSIEKADSLHGYFKLIFPSEKASVDVNNNTVVCSTIQLATAAQLARIHFPALTELTLYPSERSLAARLVQTILCGQKEIEKLPLPENELAFEIKELKGKSKDLFLLKEDDESFTRYLLDVAKRIEKSDENTARKFKELMTSFYKDSIIRQGNHFHIDDVWINVGLKSESQFVFDIVQDRYSQYLLNHPERAKEIVLKNRESTVIMDANKLFMPKDGSLDDSSFPLETFKTMLQLIEARLVTPEVVDKEIDKILKSSVMDPDIRKEIALKSGCDEREIEPLIRVKILELMFILNQAAQSDFLTKLMSVTQSELNPGDSSSFLMSPLLFPVMNREIDIVYHFENAEFDNVHIDGSLLFSPSYSSLEEKYGEIERFSDRIKLMTFTNRFDIPSLSSREMGEPVLSMLRDLRVNWKTPAEVINEIIRIVEPQQKLKISSKNASDKLDELMKDVERIEKIEKGQTGPMLDIFDPESGDLEKMARISMLFIEIGLNLQEYVQGSILENKNPKEIEAFLRKWENHLLSLGNGIDQLGMTFSEMSSSDPKEQEMIESCRDLIFEIKKNSYTSLAILSLRFDRESSRLSAMEEGLEGFEIVTYKPSIGSYKELIEMKDALSRVLQSKTKSVFRKPVDWFASFGRKDSARLAQSQSFQREFDEKLRNIQKEFDRYIELSHVEKKTLEEIKHEINPLIEDLNDLSAQLTHLNRDFSEETVVEIQLMIAKLNTHLESALES